VASRLFSLAESTFDFDEVEKRCRGWGWILTEDDPDLGVARFCVEDGCEVVFDSGKSGGLNGRACLWLALCYWPDDEDSQSADGQEGRGDAGGEAGGGRGDFDARFEAACDELRKSLGPPAGRGKYQYQHRAGWPYSYAVWRAKRGFLALQQDELDIQFGFDISIWVLAARDGEALPSFPLTGETPTSDLSVSTGTADPLWDRELDG
jgi:hypothetical protein